MNPARCVQARTLRVIVRLVIRAAFGRLDLDGGMGYAVFMGHQFLGRAGDREMIALAHHQVDRCRRALLVNLPQVQVMGIADARQRAQG